MNNNPSPGNKAGGLTTILEKSLGAVAKGGTTNLVAVYEYAEPVTAKGFVYMDTPGYDPVSATGQVAGGANLICFTTGRGSAYGCAPSPSLKLGTNTELWQRQSDDIDLNCGEIIDGTANVDEMGERIFRLMLRTASGETTKSERHGYGQSDAQAPTKSERGATRTIERIGADCRSTPGPLVHSCTSGPQTSMVATLPSSRVEPATAEQA